jgi:hypothetical protein
VFSNRQREPIEDSGEEDEGEEAEGEFIVAGGDTAEAFDAAEEVFDAVPMAVVAAMEAEASAPPSPRRDANASAVPVESRAKGVRIEALVTDRAFPAQGRQKRLDGFEVMARSGSQRSRATARPRPSTTAASLVLSPPLVRPIASSVWPPRGFEPC